MQTFDDILMYDELMRLAAEHPKRFKVWNTLTQAQDDADWKYGRGRINPEMCKEHLPAGGLESTAFLCGPDPMIRDCCIPILKAMGYPDDRIICF